MEAPHARQAKRRGWRSCARSACRPQVHRSGVAPGSRVAGGEAMPYGAGRVAGAGRASTGSAPSSAGAHGSRTEYVRRTHRTSYDCIRATATTLLYA